MIPSGASQCHTHVMKTLRDVQYLIKKKKKEYSQFSVNTRMETSMRDSQRNFLSSGSTKILSVISHRACRKLPDF
jgi:hypothetical protein